MSERPSHTRQQSSLASPLLNRTKSLDDEISLKSPVKDDAHNDTNADAFESRQPSSNMSSTAQIEQSVKLFRIVEALRSGSETQILKAIESTTANTGKLEGTTILHLAIQVAEPKVSERVLLLASPNSSGAVDIELDVNSQDKDGNTPLILASSLGRSSLVGTLLTSLKADVMVSNSRGKTALDVARTPEIYQMLQLERALITERYVKSIQLAVSKGDYDGLQKILEDQKVVALVDVNSPELPTDSEVIANGGTLLHEAAKKKDLKLAQLLLLNGADPFRRDKKGKLPQDITKDERTKAILKKSPAATAAQRGLQERTILGVSTPSGEPTIHGKESREMKGYLKKWTNYTTGYKLRWFVLEDGVLSYYKHQDDAGSACRGAMNMRIAKLSMDAQDSTRFEIIGKSSVKYHLKANHTVEAKRWFWALNNAIQWAKDADRHDKKREKIIEDAKNQAMSERRTSLDVDDASAKRSSFENSDGASATTHVHVEKDEGSVASVDGKPARAAAIPGDMDDEEEFVDDASAVEVQPVPKDAFNITAHSAHLQLELLGQVSSALSAQSRNAPHTQLSDPVVGQAIETYERAVRSLQSMVQDLLKISRDREAYWQFRLDREAEMRTLWEDSMAKVTREQEELETRIGESELKRRRTKKALKDVLGDPVVASGAGTSSLLESLSLGSPAAGDTPSSPFNEDEPVSAMIRRRSTVAAIKELSDSEDENDEEFFDAVGAGEIAAEPLASVIALPTPSATPSASEPKVDLASTAEDKDKQDEKTITKSFIGYEDPPRKRLAMDADNRPKISLWGILKSMIGKDMTKMTLPVSFNEPTSLLQRVAEDMEYTELLDAAAERTDSTERMVYVAAFATSEYASTIGRVAKPFNPLLGETFEYSRPDKGYRFVVEQVSHHPPIGAAWAESARWTYWGESAVKSKFYGKSFDINPLGTWFLRLKPRNGEEELYTWKKVTTSVVGIITGQPTVDNYGPMIVKNWNTGDVCELNFVQRGWKATSAYKVGGKVTGSDGRARWSIGGRWNDKIFARLTPGFEADLLDSAKQSTSAAYVPGSDQAFLVWAANPRPSNIPFSLTPFGVTLNALPDKLKPYLPPTDTRFRPDQRAMEDGEYDLAATEKNRVEEKQRAKRREREETGTEYTPRWFRKNTCKVSGEEYWDWNVKTGTYWDVREQVTGGKGKWDGVDDIF